MLRDCPSCGMQVDVVENTCCPKCDCRLVQQLKDQIFEVDICHGGEDWATARHKILNALDRALLGGYAGLRIIHGFGSRRGHTSFIRNHSIAFAARIVDEKDYELQRSRKNEGETVILFTSAPASGSNFQQD
jgi:hypothetical protein